MTRQSFERDLKNLQNEVVAMGGLVEKAIMESVESLRARDLNVARRLVTEDRRIINNKYLTIEAQALTLIATQQPMAGDLRTIAAVLEIAHELERMGDYGKGIAKINLMIGDEPLLKPMEDIPRMAEKACQMLHRSLEAFINRDAALARAIPKEDDEVDALYNQVYRGLLTFMLADQRAIDAATLLLWATHNLERVADRVANICERVIFSVTGERLELDVEDEGVEGI
jgi:phosphate transport system protein